MDHPHDETFGRYVGGLLEPRERAAVDAHVASCPDCARGLEELSEIDELLERLPPLSVSASLAGRVRGRLLVAGERTRLTPWRAAAAAVVLLAIGGIAGAAIATPDPVPAPLVRNVDGQKFALFFAEDPESMAVSAAERNRRMDAFMAWMQGLGDASVRLGGSELDDTRGRIVGVQARAVAPDLVLSGFLVIRAGSYDEAEALARGCPIVARGGQVIVRQLR